MSSSDRLHCMSSSDRLHCMSSSDRLHCMSSSDRLYCMSSSDRLHCMSSSDRLYSNVAPPAYPSSRDIESVLAAEASESNVVVQKTWVSPRLKMADPWRGENMSTSHSIFLRSSIFLPSHLLE